MSDARLPVVHVSGTWQEMGAALALRCRGEGGAEVLSWYMDLVPRLVGTGRAVREASNVSLATLARLNRDQVDPEVVDLFTAFGEASGVRPERALGLLYVPDLVHMAAGSLGILCPAPACSGFFAGSDLTGGAPLVGRNFDFYGRNWWNTHQAVLVFHPSGGQSFLWVGVMGLPFGHFGINEAGLGLCMFTNFTGDLSPRGTPLFSLAHRILARARSLDEVRALLPERVLAGFSLLVVDTRARDARIFGLSARHREEVAPTRGCLVRTNHYTERGDLEAAPHPWRRHSGLRHRRLTALLDGARGHLPAASVPALLSDTWDLGEDRRRVVGDVLAAVNNASSVVWSPVEDRLWVASGEYPVCHGATWPGVAPQALLSRRAEPEVAPLEPPAHLSPEEARALDLYEKAWSAWGDRHEAAEAVGLLLGAARLLREEACFPFLAGLIPLVGEGDAGEVTVARLRRAATLGFKDPHRAGEVWLWLGRALDLDGRREEAVAAYREAGTRGDDAIRKVSERHLRRPCRRGEIRRVSVELVLGTAIYPVAPRRVLGPRG